MVKLLFTSIVVLVLIVMSNSVIGSDGLDWKKMSYVGSL